MHSPPPISKSSGKTTGMGITAFFVMLLEANELAPKKRRLTDDQILAQVKAEFPNRKLWLRFGVGKKYSVNGYARAKYNRGLWTRGIPPEKVSFRYDSQGRAVDYHKGRVPLLNEEVDLIRRNYKQGRDRIIKEKVK